MSTNNTLEVLNREPLFDFNAEHNGVSCIASLKPEDRGTARQYRHTAPMYAAIFSVAVNTVRERIKTLIDTGDVDEVRNLTSSQMPYSNGSLHEVTLYDLDVFNKLAMTFIDNPKAVELRKAFSDVLVKHETKALSLEEVCRAYLAECDNRRALEADNERLEAERDEAMAQNEDLRQQVGDSKTYKAVTAITWLPDYFNLTRGMYTALAARLKKVEAGMGQGFEHIDIPDSRWGKVKAYHVDVIERFHNMVQADEGIMKLYRKVASV